FLDSCPAVPALCVDRCNPEGCDGLSNRHRHRLRRCSDPFPVGVALSPATAWRESGSPSPVGHSANPGQCLEIQPARLVPADAIRPEGLALMSGIVGILNLDGAPVDR